MNYYTQQLPTEITIYPTGFSQQVSYLLATGEFLMGSKNVTGDLTYSFPTSSADWAARQRCNATGYLAAGHSVVFVDGLPFIETWAPDHVVKPLG